MDDHRSALGAFRTRNTDLWAAAVPLLCAIHCLAVPLLVLFAPRLAPDPRTEIALLLGAGALAVILVGLGVRSHRRWKVWIPTLLGLAAWAGAHGVGSFGPPKALVEIGGALLIAAGLIWSAALRHAASAVSETGLLAAGSIELAE